MIVVKTEIMMTEQPEQIIVCKELENEIKELENEIKKAIFLSLKEKGILTQKQCEECIKRI